MRVSSNCLRLSQLARVLQHCQIAKEAHVDESEFEGTLVLEKLAEIGKLEAFFEAVDSDDLGMAKSLMKRAAVDSETIMIVIKKMENGE